GPAHPGGHEQRMARSRDEARPRAPRGGRAVRTRPGHLRRAGAGGAARLVLHQWHARAGPVHQRPAVGDLAGHRHRPRGGRDAQRADGVDRADRRRRRVPALGRAERPPAGGAVQHPRLRDVERRVQPGVRRAAAGARLLGPVHRPAARRQPVRGGARHRRRRGPPRPGTAVRARGRPCRRRARRGRARR
ncbi:MAG: hypothetical protein AVDCRST_MAG66-1622, partial [uncultured Pseudonocardia sp.]